MGVKPAPGTQQPQVLELHIEELVLRGFPASSRLEISDAVERELRHLVAEQGVGALTDGLQTTDRLDAGSFRAADGARPRTLGAQIGKAVFGGLTKR